MGVRLIELMGALLIGSILVSPVAHAQIKLTYANFQPAVTFPCVQMEEWKKEVDAHLKWWQAIVDTRKAEGAESLTICPEFGPPNYMATRPGTGTPLSDQWAINCYMKDFLRDRLLL
jgi:hypothetical protein